MKHIGSQNRETLKEAETILIKSIGETILTLNLQGQFELWDMHNYHSGYTLEYDGVGYEFVRSLSPQEGYEFLSLELQPKSPRN